MALTTHPLRPRLAYRLGVTGHRLTRLSPHHIDRIRANLQIVLDQVEATVHQAHAKYSDFYTSDQPVIRMVSALADGADSIAADVALKSGWELAAPIPFPRTDYVTDFEKEQLSHLRMFFEQADTTYELDGHRTDSRSERAAYLSAGYMTLKQADMMIAIWDGEGARGIGGTGMIVEAAVQQGIPVIWIHAHEDQPLGFLSEELGLDKPLSALQGLISQELSPPFLEWDEAEDEQDPSTERLAAQNFFQEGERRTNYGIFYRLLEATLMRRRPRGMNLRRDRYSPRSEEEWSAFEESLTDLDPKTAANMKEVLLPRYCWADNLALYYSDIYRSSYSLNYLLSALAVFLALFELMIGFGKPLWISMEVVTILAVLYITLRGKKNRWHERWIDYRQLAEQLRHLRYLYLSGGASRDAQAAQSQDLAGEDGSWAQWYYQATMRELGMASAQCTSSFKDQLTDLFIRDELNKQIDYHKAKSADLHHMEHALHITGEYVFGATLAICLAFLALIVAAGIEGVPFAYDLKKLVQGPVTAATGFLPALGAALFGIRVQGEFASTADRSIAMMRRLSTTRTELEALLSKGAPTMRELRRNIESAAETMLIEIVDWRFVYSSKPLSLPA